MFCIVGADGFFGSYFIRHIMESCSEKIVALNHNSPVFPDSPQLINVNFELSDNDSIKNAAQILSHYNNIKILFLAAVHNPDIVKINPERALYINTVCYENFLLEIKGLDIKKLFFASSDTAYGESTNNFVFTEKDIPAPVNIYGEQKLLGEKITLKHGYQIIRYSYLCGPSLTNRKKHFFDTITDTISGGENIYLFTDWKRPALCYKTAAEITNKLFEAEADEKIINVCSDTSLTKYEIGLKIAEHNHLKKELIIPVTKNELNIFTEKRADDIYMDNSLLKKLLNIKTLELEF